MSPSASRGTRTLVYQRRGLGWEKGLAGRDHGSSPYGGWHLGRAAQRVLAQQMRDAHGVVVEVRGQAPAWRERREAEGVPGIRARSLAADGGRAHI